MLSDPIVALATTPGRAGLALIGLSGAGAFALAARCLHPFHPEPARTAFRARLAHPGSGSWTRPACARAKSASSGWGSK